MLSSNSFCKAACGTRLSASRKRSGFCAGCDVNIPQRIEHVIVPKILEHLNGVGAARAPSSWDDATFGGAACGQVKKYRPDVVWLDRNITVVLEIDEHSHTSYPCECEASRMSDLASLFKSLLEFETVIYFLRVNPDAYDRATVTLEERSRVVGKRLMELFSESSYHAPNVTDGLLFHVEYFYYHTTKGAHHIRHMRDQSSVASVAVLGHGSSACAVVSE